MLNSDMLEVAVGLIFVYLLFSFVATAAREGLEGLLKDRGRYLERGILSLMSEPHGDDLGPERPAHDGRVDAQEAKDRAESLLEQLYRSPPVHGLFRGNYVVPTAREGLKWLDKLRADRRLPSYIPSQQFAEGLLAVVMRYSNPKAGGPLGSLDRLRLAVEGVPNAQVRNVVRTAIQLSGGDPDRMRKHIQDWYDGAMDRVSGQYRRHTQWWVMLTSAAVAILLNVNTLVIAQALTTNEALRNNIAQRAETVSKDQAYSGADMKAAREKVQAAEEAVETAAKDADAAAADGTRDAAKDAEVTTRKAEAKTALEESRKLQDEKDKLVDAQVEDIRSLGLPVGWDPKVVEQVARIGFTGAFAFDFCGWRVHPVGGVIVLLGWLMTGLAISLGAPFWFDVLNKFMIVRATVKPEEKSPAEGSKDGKGAPPPPDDDPAGAAPKMPTAGPSAIADDERQEIAQLEPHLRPREGDDEAADPQEDPTPPEPGPAPPATAAATTDDEAEGPQ